MLESVMLGTCCVYFAVSSGGSLLLLSFAGAVMLLCLPVRN